MKISLTELQTLWTWLKLQNCFYCEQTQPNSLDLVSVNFWGTFVQTFLIALVWRYLFSEYWSCLTTVWFLPCEVPLTWFNFCWYTVNLLHVLVNFAGFEYQRTHIATFSVKLYWQQTYIPLLSCILLLAHLDEQFLQFSGLGFVTHWWHWCDWSLIPWTYLPSVLWHCWLVHLPHKTCPQYRI